METPLNEKSCTIYGAALALGRSTETLRGWLARGGGTYLFTINKGGWRRFFGVDIALMTIAAPMIEFGLKPEFAFKMAREAILEKVTIAEPTWSQAKHLSAAFAVERILVRHDADRWRAELTSDRHELASLGGPALVLNPSGLIRDALWRLEGEIY